MPSVFCDTMKLNSFLLSTAILALGAGYFLKDEAAKQRAAQETQNQIQTGDIIFQQSGGSQARAIQLATHSKWTHCGVIIRKGTETMVLEAVEPVRMVPLETFIANGINKVYEVRRLKPEYLTLNDSLSQLFEKTGNTFLNKHYDIHFNWSDDFIYCSELVYKTYERAWGIKPGAMQKLGEFDLSNPVVKQKLAERYGKHIPLNEPVISPSAIYASPLLEALTVGK